MVDFFKKLQKFETDEEKLKYLEEEIKKIKDKDLKKEIKDFIEELKRKIVNRNLFREGSRREGFNEVEFDEIKYEPKTQTLEQDVGGSVRVEQLEVKEEPFQYGADLTDIYKSYAIESPFLRLVEEFPELPKAGDIDIRGRVGDSSIENILKGVGNIYNDNVVGSANELLNYVTLGEYKGSGDVGEDLKRRKKISDKEYMGKQDGIV
ncbi:MAG: hypothetical protein KJ674_01770 [Nanoarchaeota archaeon]|nr:hypothetical protein [Nanoarchaeota archaeon]